MTNLENSKVTKQNMLIHLTNNLQIYDTIILETLSYDVKLLKDKYDFIKHNIMITSRYANYHLIIRKLSQCVFS